MYNPKVLNDLLNESQLRAIAQDIHDRKSIAATKQIEASTEFSLKESLLIIHEFTRPGAHFDECHKSAIKFMRIHGYEF